LINLIHQIIPSSSAEFLPLFPQAIFILLTILLFLILGLTERGSAKGLLLLEGFRLEISV
jgi:hypothetical protein